MNWLLEKLKIHPNAYYNYRKYRKNAKEKHKTSVLKTITKLYHGANGIPGYRMMRQLLENEGTELSLQTVRRYMNVELELRSITRKGKYHYHKGPEAYAIYEDLLGRDFHADERNTKWCIDFTYLKLRKGGKRYNCTIIDLYDRRVVASVSSNHIDAELAIRTVSRALRKNKNKTGIILHSDRGSQFTSERFVRFCKENGITQSMSRPGCPYDNAPMERYFNTMKAELINLKTFSTEKALYDAISVYAYGWYNNQRPHSYNGGLPPAKVA